MKWFLLGLVMISVLFLSPPRAHSQNAEGVYRALKRVEAKCQAGVNRRDYKEALSDAMLEFNLYKESVGSQQKSGALAHLALALESYRVAGKLWDSGLETINRTSILEIYPELSSAPFIGDEIHIDSVMELLWKKASGHLSQIHLKKAK